MSTLRQHIKKTNMNTEILKKKRNGYKLNGFTLEDIGDDHLFTGLETPMKADAFKLTDTEKKERIAILFEEIMDVMGLDLTDDSLQGTPKRVAKMYIDEIFSGLNPANKPKIALFDNKYQYNQMLVEKVIGLSKLNRIVQYYAKRPQVQERLTNQIAEDLKTILDTDDVAVIIDAKHLCVSSRGIKDDTSATVTTYYGGQFNTPDKIRELQNYLNN